MNALAQPIERVRDYLEDPWEMQIYKAIRAAAQADRPCPTCDDLVDLTGANAVATTVNIVKRLEQRGLIQVRRCQRERHVYVPEIGKWTRQPVNDAEPWIYAAVTISDVRKTDPDLALNIIERAEKAGAGKKAAMMEILMAGAKALGLTVEVA